MDGLSTLFLCVMCMYVMGCLELKSGSHPHWTVSPFFTDNRPQRVHSFPIPMRAGPHSLFFSRGR